VYSVGVVLYELVCGVAPFVAESPVSVAYKHVREEPVPPRQRNPEVPAALEQIIMSALAKDPEHRYQSADDLRADLLRFRRGRPLMAAPVTAMIAEVPTGAVTAVGTAAYAASATVASPRVPVDTQATKEPNRRRHPALFTIITLLVLAAIVGGILFASMKLGSNQASVTVPQVNSEKQVGLVVAQDPKPGEPVKKNSKVTLSISVGVGKVQVPEVAGMTVAQARAALTEAKLEVAVDGAQSSQTVDPGSVVSSSPASGTQIDVGTTVHIVPSSGVSIPNVLNFPQATAAVALRNAGLNPQAIPTESGSVTSGNVIRTDPAAGTNNIAAGSIIRVYISTGVPQVSVPTVIGKTVEKAQQALQDGNLQSSVVNAPTTLKGNDGKVLDQSPAGGILVDPQTTVVLTVGVFTAATTSTPTTAGGGPSTTTVP
jgi:serine/threonine-protein kinase